MTKFHIWKLLLAKIMSLLFWKILWKIIICWIIKRVYLLSMIEYQNLNAFVHIPLEVLKVSMSCKNTFSSFLQLLATKKVLFICLEEWNEIWTISIWLKSKFETANLKKNKQFIDFKRIYKYSGLYEIPYSVIFEIYFKKCHSTVPGQKIVFFR